MAILAWSSENLLPGHPVLEARLHATSSGIAPFVEGRIPDVHFLRGLGWFRALGLQEPRAQTFAGDAYAPLSDDTRAALQALFEMRWPGVDSELAEADRAEYRRLCLPESPEFILDHPDYYALFTCSMFQGRVARHPPEGAKRISFERTLIRESSFEMCGPESGREECRRP